MINVVFAITTSIIPQWGTLLGDEMTPAHVGTIYPLCFVGNSGNISRLVQFNNFRPLTDPCLIALSSNCDGANKQGYPTLAIDRIGVGNSTHPNPITEQPVNLEEAVSHELVMALKAGTAVFGKSFNHVIFIGHSYGSILGSAQATNHPDDIAAFVPTSYRVSSVPILADAPQTLPLSAQTNDPARFDSHSLGNLVLSSKARRRGYLWGRPGFYGEAVSKKDFEDSDVVGLGKVASVPIGMKEMSDSTEPVFIVTGDSDDVFSLLAMCGNGASSPQAQACSLFPKSENCNHFNHKYRAYDQSVLFRPGELCEISCFPGRRWILRDGQCILRGLAVDKKQASHLGVDKKINVQL